MSKKLKRGLFGAAVRQNDDRYTLKALGCRGVRHNEVYDRVKQPWPEGKEG